MMIQSLEPRTFLSASPINTTIAADRLEIKADLLAFRSDLARFAGTIMTDNKALRADKLSKDATLEPLFKSFRADVKSMQHSLASDRLAETAATLKDQSSILLIRRREILDRKNPAALATDQANLATAKVQLQTDEVAGLTNRINTRQADLALLTADLNAINAGATASTTASPQLKTDVNAFVADRTASLNVFSSGLVKISNARTQLIADLTAFQSQS